MIKFAKEGLIELKDYCPDYSVVVQQLFSILYSNCGVNEIELHGIFKEFCPENVLTEILIKLEEDNWMTKISDKFYPTEKLLDFGEDGKIHSNISDSKIDLIDIATGQNKGKIQIPIDEVFLLTGIVWKVEKMQRNKVYARAISSKNLQIKRYKNLTKGAFYKYLPDLLKTKEI
jgi:ATP-dependent Lhr-like helicase